ncbi:MAG: InlB B-repeat-containing protein [Clostridia bacterium]|nr:InlB B-repeat-containing protein [Clostridia bacterium]
MKVRSIVLYGIAAVVLILALLFVVGGAGDVDLPRTFTIKFETGEGATQIAPQTVKEGYKIEPIQTPTHTKTAIFRGWYADEDYTQPWDVENYRVMGDTTLYAKWSFPTETPTEFALGTDGFTKSITWIQTGIEDATDVIVSVIPGEEKPNMVWDERTEEYVQQGTIIDYDILDIDILTGYLDVYNNQITFTANKALTGGVYKVIITTVDGLKTTEFEGIRFKGTGTQDDPYLVYSEQDLLHLTTNSFDSNTYAKEMNNITINSVYAEKRGCIYDGKFDGNGKTITIKNNSGLFYELGENAEVYNLSLKGSISGSDPSLGVLANYNSGYIHDVKSLSVSVKSTGGKVNDISSLAKGGAGGIVGTNKAKGRITACQVVNAQDNTINGRIGVGCVAGVNYGKVYNMTIEGIVGAYNGNEISQTINNTFCGTVVGVNYGEVSQVYSEGKANSRRIPDGKEGDGANNVGGIVGYNATGATISECFFAGMRVVGDTNVGGIAGYNDGTVINCYTGRRLRKPSNTTEEERQFISPVMGSYNVGGIVGQCGPNSKISNVFSTANVWAYGEQAYAIAEKADNAVYVTWNQNRRTADRWLGQKYGVVFSDELLAPIGNNLKAIDNSSRKNLVINHLLGWDLVEVKNEYTGEMVLTQVKNEQLCEEILEILGNKFKADSTWGIVLGWNR